MNVLGMLAWLRSKSTSCSNRDNDMHDRRMSLRCKLRLASEDEAGSSRSMSISNVWRFDAKMSLVKGWVRARILKAAGSRLLAAVKSHCGIATQEHIR